MKTRQLKASKKSELRRPQNMMLQGSIVRTLKKVARKCKVSVSAAAETHLLSINEMKLQKAIERRFKNAT